MNEFIETDGFSEMTSIEEVERYLGKMKELKVDTMKWLSAYEDKEGRIWMESYTTGGHASIPHVHRLDKYTERVNPGFDYETWKKDD
ncbi:hypothetical protein [Pelagicoccus mobilis]|uniref:Uncharacterized protein n=1 Tax=Pelagicoccus mobilis TaxID=415221 RepID=A0A934S4Q4_9BACT|nr:hypothetical protein [Pelagicoccus mobilis]MBK1880696.1 hypothetical protein [Pelagicoccus mobilis]